jgi:fructokinase
MGGNRQGRIVVCGEALLDLVECGEATYRAYPGGSPANVAVSLARLDVPTALLARLPGGSFGTLLRNHLTGSGVDLGHAVSAAEPATLAAVSYGAGGVADYQFWIGGTADWQWQPSELPDPVPDHVDVVHTGSLALLIEPGASVLTGWLQRLRDRGRVVISFDPNIRPGLDVDRAAALRRVERQIELAHIVKASAEDLAWLTPKETPQQVARRWAGLGPGLVVITLGEQGALAITAGGVRIERPGVSVDVLDTVGAGDAFTAGLLARAHRAGLLADGLAEVASGDLAELLNEGITTAALTCTRAGADPPDQAMVQRFRPTLT